MIWYDQSAHILETDSCGHILQARLGQVLKSRVFFWGQKWNLEEAPLLLCEIYRCGRRKNIADLLH